MLIDQTHHSRNGHAEHTGTVAKGIEQIMQYMYRMDTTDQFLVSNTINSTSNSLLLTL